MVEIGRALDHGAELRGVLTHAGESYGVYGKEAHAAFAERERSAAVNAAGALRAAGLECPVVSIGSTPTAHAVRDVDGVTEVRAGVCAFFDLVQAGIDVCEIDDIALSVLTTVVGHQQAKDRIITDAGWMALSKDRGTADQRVDQGYGVVCDEMGNVLPVLVVVGVNQEHGIVSRRPGSTVPLPDLPVGTRLRVLPNHACATAAHFDRYNVVLVGPGAPLEVWHRFVAGRRPAMRFVPGLPVRGECRTGHRCGVSRATPTRVTSTDQREGSHALDVADPDPFRARARSVASR